jgi:hypothetical protein
MSAQPSSPQILVGPRVLDDRVCRLVYVRATDEVWAEEWRTEGWVRTSALVRLVLKAPVPKPAALKRRGIPVELGVWDREEALA